MSNVVPISLARNNGRVCYESNVPMVRGNPYRKGSNRHADFITGYIGAANAEVRHLNTFPKGRSS